MELREVRMLTVQLLEEYSAFVQGNHYKPFTHCDRKKFSNGICCDYHLNYLKQIHAYKMRAVYIDSVVKQYCGRQVSIQALCQPLSSLWVRTIIEGLGLEKSSSLQALLDYLEL